MTIQCLYVFPSKEAIERLVTPSLALERSVKDYPFVGMNSYLYADVPKVISKLAGRELPENEFNTVLNQVVGLNSRVRELPEENYWGGVALLYGNYWKRALKRHLLWNCRLWLIRSNRSKQNTLKIKNA